MNRIFGMVFDIKRYALHDGPGIRVTVHLKGCPLSCWWCHNPESQRFGPQLLYRGERCVACDLCVAACPKGAISTKGGVMSTHFGVCDGCGACSKTCPSEARVTCGDRMSVSEVMKSILKERIFFEQSGGGVTLSGGEPMAQPEFVMELLSECKKYGIHTALDTCGFVDAEILLDTIPFTDLYLYDIKHIDPAKHKKYTGVDNNVILSNIAKLGERGAAINVRVPFVPSVNTDEENLRAMAVFLSGVRGIVGLNLLPYHSAAEDKHDRWGMEFHLRGIRTPTEASLRRAVEVMESQGVRAVTGD